MCNAGIENTGAVTGFSYFGIAEAAIGAGAAEALQEIKFAEQLPGAHFFEWRLRDEQAFSSPGFKKLFGIPVGEPLTSEAVLSRVHPMDAERVRAGQQAVLQKSEPFEDEFRVLLPDGATRWILARGEPIVAGGEIIGLAGSNLDITDRKLREVQLARKEAALREREAMFRTLADAMPQMVWSARPDGHHDYFNARWYEFTGVENGSTFGEQWSEIFHPEDRVKAKTLWQQALDTGTPYEIEYRLRHNSGEYRWTLGRALPHVGEEGRIIRWFGTCTDIHDAKMHAEQSLMLGQELRHRIKNIFSIIQGIVTLTARLHPEAKGFANSLKKRISALSRAHSLVHVSMAEVPESGGVTLHALLREILSPYPALEEGRISIEGDDFALRADAITSLALILHEFATNASKYGSLKLPQGRLRIACRVEGDQVSIAWKETGGPTLTTIPEHSGFGTTLSALTVEAQLKGTIDRSWLPEGLDVIMTCPTDRVNARLC